VVKPVIIDEREFFPQSQKIGNRPSCFKSSEERERGLGLEMSNVEI
jgi:hypothetical protein